MDFSEEPANKVIGELAGFHSHPANRVSPHPICIESLGYGCGNAASNGFDSKGLTN
jgi:hypothetical protein